MFSINHNHVTFAIVILSATPSIAQRADFKVPANQLNRRFSWSTEAPLTRAINELAPDVIPHTDLVTRHFGRVERAVLDSLTRTKELQDAPVQPCNPHIQHRYRSSVRRAFALRGLLEPAWNCGSDVSGVKMSHEDAPGYTLDDIYEAIFFRSAALKRRVEKIATRLIDNFTQPEISFNFTFDTTSARCVLNPVCMYREGEHWHVNVGVHSNGINEYVADGNRLIIVEYPRVVNGALGDNLLLRLPLYDDGNVERVFLDNTTTLIQRWRRAPNPSCFSAVPMDQNPALLDSLDQAKHSSQQVEDALTTSNMAILLLPLGLNLVPVALISNVGTRKMLAYTILSDVLTVVPLAIKGVELVLIGQQRFRSVVGRVMTNDIGNSTEPAGAGGELWGAECRVRDEVGRMGVVFIIAALAFLCIGVSAEFAAKWYRRTKLRKRRRNDPATVVERRNLMAKSGNGTGSGKSNCQSLWSADDEMSVMDWEVGACGVRSRYSDDEDQDSANFRKEKEQSFGS